MKPDIGGEFKQRKTELPNVNEKKLEVFSG